MYLLRAQDVYAVQAYTTDAENRSLLQDCTHYLILRSYEA